MQSSLSLRRMTASLFAVAAVLAASSAACADAWPDHPIRFIVPFSPGGANDLIARAAAEGVSKRLGQPVIIENKPGAGTIVGADYVARSKPDGYTFLIGSAGVVTNSLINDKMPYADRDLLPVGMIAVAPSVIVVNPGVPASNIKEFIAWAKSKGDAGVDFATAGSASTPHFVEEMLKDATGVKLVVVPFKSGSESVNAVIGGSVAATSEASIVVLPQIKAGRLKAIATTYGKRISAYPSISTATEQGYPGVLIGHWAGLLAPKGTPAAIIEKMNAALQEALRSKETRDQLLPAGIEPEPGSVADFTAFMASERERLGKVAARAHMHVE